MPATSPLPLRGDEADLYAELQPRMLRLLRLRIAGSDALIEDACAFAWLQLLRCQPRRDSVYGWLCKTAIHAAYNLSRRERRDIRLDGWAPDTDAESVEPASDPLEVEVERREAARHALDVLAEMPERQRRYHALLASGHSYREICQLTGATYTNVNKHLARASARIHDERVQALAA